MDTAASTWVSSDKWAQKRLTWLLNEFEKPILRYLVIMLADSEPANDCVQEAFLRAYSQLLRGRDVNERWLYKVARNLAIDFLRRRQRELSKEAPEAAAPIYNEGFADVHAALLQLAPSDREILYLAEVDGFSSKEIGALLGVRAGAVRMRLSRAHVRFKAAYGAKQ